MSAPYVSIKWLVNNSLTAMRAALDFLPKVPRRYCSVRRFSPVRETSTSSPAPHPVTSAK